MQLVLLIVVVSLVAISVIAVVTIRIRLKNKSKELSEKLNHISSYSNKSNYEQAKERLSALNNETFIETCFKRYPLQRLLTRASCIC